MSCGYFELVLVGEGHGLVRRGCFVLDVVPWPFRAGYFVLDVATLCWTLSRDYFELEKAWMSKELDFVLWLLRLVATSSWSLLKKGMA